MYRRKPPILQIKILLWILRYGEISKTVATKQIGSNYPDVSDAFGSLLKKNLIIKSTEESSWDIKNRRGRNIEKFYKLTTTGLEFLLEINLGYSDFWKAVILRCLTNGFNQEEFDKLYYEHENKILGYNSASGYFIRSLNIYELYQVWFHNNYLSKSLEENYISNSQKILETLAIHRNLSADGILEKTDIPIERIKELLDYEPDFKTIPEGKLLNGIPKDLQKIETLPTNEKNNTLLMNLLVTSRYNKDTNENVYELTVFGVMLTLAIIRRFYKEQNNDVNVDQFSYFNLFSDNVDLVIATKNIFFYELDIKKYFDIIINNYREKIPLIFGKWGKLKLWIGSLLYENFDFLIFKDSKNNTLNSSELLEKSINNEFYQEYISLVQNGEVEIKKSGIEADRQFQEFEKNGQPLYKNKITKEMLKINQIQDVSYYIETRDELGKFLQYEDKSPVHRLFYIPPERMHNFEKFFAKEVSFLFYLNMHYDSDLHMSTLQNISEMKLQKCRLEYVGYGPPKLRLLSFLVRDPKLKQWFCNILESIISYKIKSLKKMNHHYDHISSLHKKDADFLLKTHQDNNKYLISSKFTNRPLIEEFRKEQIVDQDQKDV